MIRRLNLLLLLLVFVFGTTSSWAATYYAQGNGDINAVEWDTVAVGGGTDLAWANLLPADILVANGKTVAINVSFTCAQINTLTSGGTFTVAAAVTIIANISRGTTDCLTASGGPYTLTITGSASCATTTANVRPIVLSGTVSLVMTGDVTGGSSNNGQRGIYSTSTGTITINGNVTAGSNYQCEGIQHGNGAVSVTGTVTGGGVVSATGINCGSGKLTVTAGNLIFATGKPVAYTGEFEWNPGATNYIGILSSGGLKKYGKTIPAASVIEGVNGDGAAAPAVGTYHAPETSEVLYGAAFGATTGTLTLPTASQVLDTIQYGADGTQYTGNVTLPAASKVLTTATFGPSGGTTGTYVAVPAKYVKKGVRFGAASALKGTLPTGKSGGMK